VDPLEETPWSKPETIRGFVESPPNDVLMRFATGERGRVERGRALDLGCGAGRNALPLARLGWSVLGIDLSVAMLRAAAQRLGAEPDVRLQLALAPMDRLPVRDASCDLIVAHGIWNLARSAAEFRRAVREAARVATPGAALFVFTFSRHTLSADARPVRGEPFVFTRFSGQPQCFLTETELVSELAAAGFAPDPRVPLRELNRPQPGACPMPQGPPVIYEGAFRFLTTPAS
jgi:SAM-dependent methyltransferase